VFPGLWILSILLFRAVAIPGQAADASTQFLNGNEAYRAGHYEEARAAYQNLVEQAPCAAAHYNLANADCRRRRLGQAIPHYEKALRFDPRNSDIQSNLDHARAQIKSKQPEVETDFLTRIVWSTLTRISMSECCKIFTIFVWIFTSLLTVGILNRRLRLRKWLFLMTLPAAVMVLAAVILLGFKLYEFEALTPGVVLEAEVSALAGPAEGQTRKFVLQEGHKVFIVDHRPGWCRVALQTGANGWVRTESINEI